MSERGNLSFQSFVTNREGAQELTESRYNLLIGLMLAWGFGLNFAITQLLGPRLLGIAAGGGMLAFVIAYFVLVMIGSGMVRSHNAGTCFIGYNLIALPVGALVAMATAAYDPGLVARAALSTAIVTLMMMIVSSLIPQVFERIV